MSQGDNQKAMRPNAAWLALAAGILVAIYGVLNTITQVRGAKLAGGALKYLGVSRWQDHLPFVFWGFSLPIAATLVLIAAALRHSKLSGKLAVGLPIGFLGAIVFVGLILTFPTVVPAFFGMGGVINAICIVVTVYLCASRISHEDPWPGFLRSLGYLTFASTAWFTCGVLSTPGTVLFPELERDQAIITDLAHKVQLCWVLGWSLTALGFVLERRAAAAARQLDPAHRVEAHAPAAVARIASAGASRTVAG